MCTVKTFGLKDVPIKYNTKCGANNGSRTNFRLNNQINAINCCCTIHIKTARKMCCFSLPSTSAAFPTIYTNGKHVAFYKRV